MRRNWNEHELFKFMCRDRPTYASPCKGWFLNFIIKLPLDFQLFLLDLTFSLKVGYLRQQSKDDAALVGTWGSEHQPHSLSHSYVTSFWCKTKLLFFIPWLSKTLVKRLLEQHCNLFKRWQTLCLHRVKGHLTTALPCLSW